MPQAMQALVRAHYSRRSDEQVLDLMHVRRSAPHRHLHMHGTRTCIVPRSELRVAGVPEVMITPLSSLAHEANHWAAQMMCRPPRCHLHSARPQQALHAHKRLQDDGELMLQVPDMVAAPFLCAR